VTGLWIQPQFPAGRLEVFAVLLALLLAWQLLTSPRRRRYLGVVRFTLAAALATGVPLFAVVALRAGFRHAYLDAGAGWWSAMFFSLLWMVVFLIVAGWITRRVPPFSWLSADWRRARMQGWRMFFGGASQPQTPEEPDGEGMRVVGRSSFVRDGALHRSR
jgi:small-conductance mechanosensitive channel